MPAPRYCLGNPVYDYIHGTGVEAEVESEDADVVKGFGHAPDVSQGRLCWHVTYCGEHQVVVSVVFCVREFGRV